jgi:hypothetical protein
VESVPGHDDERDDRRDEQRHGHDDRRDVRIDGRRGQLGGSVRFLKYFRQKIGTMINGRVISKIS